MINVKEIRHALKYQGRGLLHLADHLTTAEGGKPLDAVQRTMIREAMLPHLDEILRRIKMDFIMFHHERDLEASCSELMDFSHNLPEIWNTRDNLGALPDRKI